MAKKSFKKHQMISRRKGCSKKIKKTRKKYLGGNIDLGKSQLTQANPIFSNTHRGGGCDTCGASCMSGGNCVSCNAVAASMSGGEKHRKECKCSACKIHQSGGNQVGPNYLALNNYSTDISRQMASGGGKYKKSKTKTKKQRGGALSSFIAQDLINLGRQFQFGMGSAYNALNGYGGPASPMPWKDQLPNSSNINSIRSSYSR